MCKKNLCETCRGKEKIEVCDNCGKKMQQIDVYPKLTKCFECGKGKPKTVNCPACTSKEQEKEGEFVKEGFVYLNTVRRTGTPDGRAVKAENLLEETLFKISALEAEKSKIIFMSPSEICSKYHMQGCSVCERLECVDNTSEAKSLTARIEKHQKAMVEIRDSHNPMFPKWRIMKIYKKHLDDIDHTAIRDAE